MAANIKGITVEIGGNTTKLEKALTGVNKTSKDLQGELKQVDRLLKFDPKNTELLSQKQKILSESIENTKDKLKTLKTVEKEVQQQFKQGKISEEQYRALKREIEATEQNLKGLNTKLDEHNNKWKTVSDTIDKYGEKARNAGRKASTYVTAPLVAGAGVAVKYASDLEEALNKTEVAFGDSSDSVVKWSKDTLNAYGIAQGSALDMVSLFGDMGTSMGISDADAADMSKTLVGLAGDLASFKNIGIDQAETALKSIFTGETESLKGLGIVMTQANLDAFALAEGYGKTTKEMTESEKVQLRYAFVLSRTANAQGDFERTGGGTANQLRVMQESTKELAASFGKELLPVITPILKSFNELLKKFAEMSPETKKMVLVIAGIAAAIGPLLMILGLMASGVSSIIGLVGIVGPIIGGLAAPIAIAIAAIAAIVAIGVLLYKNWDTIKEKASELWASITATFDNIKTAVSDKMAAMGDAVRGAIEKIKSFFSFKWELPKIKLPHFDLKGKFSFVPPQVPKLSVNWYKDGGIFANPSVIGVGEAGTEAVLPIDKLDSILAKALEKAGGGTMDHTGTITVKGVTDKGQLVGISNMLMSDMARGERRNRR